MLARFGEATLGTRNPRDLDFDRFNKIVSVLEDADKNSVNSIDKIYIGTILIADYISSLTSVTINNEFTKNDKKSDLLKLFIHHNQTELIEVLLSIKTFNVKEEHTTLVTNALTISNMLERYRNPQEFDIKTYAYPMFVMACNGQFDELISHSHRLKASLCHSSMPNSVTFYSLMNYQFCGYLCGTALNGQTLLNIVCETGNKSSKIEKSSMTSQFQTENILNQKQVNYAQELLNLGCLASINNKENRMLSLHYAVRHDNADLIRLIYSSYIGACNVKDSNGKLPLDYANEVFKSSLLYAKISSKQQQLSR